MPDPRQYVRPGQRLQIAASQINALNQMMRQDTGFRAPPPSQVELASNIVMVLNDSGQNVPWLGVLELSSPIISPVGGTLTGSEPADISAKGFASGNVLLAGVMPTGGAKPVAIAMEPIESGKIGRMAVGGRFACKVLVTGGDHSFARGRVGDVTQLISTSCGPVRLLWKQGVANDQWALGAM
jgi:hypothetical protein